MQIFRHPQRADWPSLLKRPYTDSRAVLETVSAILADVRNGGDAAVRALTRKFTGADLADPLVPAADFDRSERQLSDSLKTAIGAAAKNIETFHRAQLQEPTVVETAPGIRCWRRSVGIDRVGLYIPGGTAPLFSTLLMLGIPARLAGCREIVLCTPCDVEGRVHPAILYSARLVGITQVWRLGGAQAVAAMAYGTETMRPVYKIFGPGNQYVTAAKQLVQLDGVAIDMPAGPSEVCVLADAAAHPAFIAADLLSQAEHGADSQVLLITDSQELVTNTLLEIERRLALLPRKEPATRALANSRALVVKDLDEGIDLANAYAAEHLIICTARAGEWAERVTNAGSVFIGGYSPESVGDYASGTNHTLPTNGFARAYSGVSIDSFVKKITFQQLAPEGLEQIAGTVIAMAEAEGLQAHAEAVRVRLNEKNRYEF